MSDNSKITGTPTAERGDMNTGDGNAVPTREPISVPPTIGNANARARIGARMGAQANVADSTATPALQPIAPVKNTRTTLPAKGRQT